MEGKSVHPIRVSCYSSYRGEERPISFEHEGKAFRIIEIIDHWIEEHAIAGRGAKRCFRVKADDKQSYLLFFDQNSNEWFLDQPSSEKRKSES